MLSLREIGLTADDIKNWFEREFKPRNVKVDGSQIYCSCPIPGHNHKHGDRSPSFSLDCENGCWYCHSSGDSGNIKQLAEKCGVPTPWNGRGKIPQRQTIYVYENADGKPLYEVVRVDDPSGKRIFQRAISPDGKRVNSMRGVTRVPYRLQEILEAQADNQPIFIVEGEKCVEALRALGLVATTNSGGSGKWNDCGQYFQKGISVIILTDNDEPGRRHACEVATDLKQRGCSVKILNLPNLPTAGDVADWLRAGHGKEELLNLVERCEEWDLEQVEVEDVERKKKLLSLAKAVDEIPSVKIEMIAGLFPRGGISILAAPSGCYKSLIVQRIASELSTGSKVLGGLGGIEPPKRTIYFNGEMNDGLFRERKQTFGFRDDPDFFKIVDKKRSLDEAELILDLGLPEGRLHVKELLQLYWAALGQIDLIVFDSLSSFSGGVSLNDQKETSSLLEFANNLAKEFNTAVLIVHHLKKRKLEERGQPLNQDDMAGSYWLAGQASYVYMIGEKRDKESGEVLERVVLNTKSRSKPKPPFAFSVEEKEDGSSEFSINLTPSLGDSKKENVWNKQSINF